MIHLDNLEDLKGRETELEKRRPAREGLEEALVFLTHKLICVLFVCVCARIRIAIRTFYDCETIQNSKK